MEAVGKVLGLPSPLDAQEKKDLLGPVAQEDGHFLLSRSITREEAASDYAGAAMEQKEIPFRLKPNDIREALLCMQTK